MIPIQLYLDLLKKTVAFSLWEQPPIPIMTLNYTRSPLRARIFSTLDKLLAKKRMVLTQYPPVGNLIEANHWYTDSMIGVTRLDNLQYCVETVLGDRIEGDLIETGVWRGGACILMKAVLVAYDVKDRKVFVADSFRGLPKPEWPQDAGDRLYVVPFLAVSQEEVEQNFRKYGLLDNQVVFLKGWFKDTLPTAPIRKLAVLRLDGDMYGSTMDSLNSLYHKLSSGGFCIIDDYGLLGCKQAVDDFRAENGVVEEMKVIDWTGRFWRKA